MDITKKIFKNSSQLENYYNPFWNKILHNNSYVFYKQAILFYANTQNNKFHNFFSSLINKRLWSGKCMPDKKTIENFNNISPNELCSLVLQVINTLDIVFTIAPKLPKNIVVYRKIILSEDNYLLHLKKNTFFVSPEFYSTTINPYRIIPDDFLFQSLPHIPEKYLLFSIILPKNTPAYYINIPFTKDKSSYFEMEIMLPRNSIYYIKNISIFQNIHLITLQYIDHKQTHPITKIQNTTPSTFIKNKIFHNKILKTQMKEEFWIEKILHKNFNQWNSLPENEKFFNPSISSISPLIFFFTNASKINNIIPKNTLIHSKNNIQLYNLLTTLYIPNKNPVLYLYHISNHKKYKMQHKYNYQYFTLTNIKIKILSQKNIYITNQIFYSYITAITI